MAVGEDDAMDLKPVCQGVLQLRQGDAVSAGYAFVAGLHRPSGERITA